MNDAQQMPQPPPHAAPHSPPACPCPLPLAAPRRWIRSLHLPVTSPWRPWYSGGQVGGYVQDYQGISFATVRGAGHMVPYTQPQRAYDLLQAFLQGGDPAPSQLAA